MNEYENALQGWLGASVPPETVDSDEDDELDLGGRLGAPVQGPEHLRALDRVAEWTRERFKLPADTVVLVSQVTCTIPGCPPLDTVVAFWTADGTRYHFKMSKPVADVTPDDLPFAWLMSTLVSPEGFGCECC